MKKDFIDIIAENPGALILCSFCSVIVAWLLVWVLFLAITAVNHEKPRNYYRGEEIDLPRLSAAIADTWENEYLSTKK
jgi:hypothetical protein